MSNPTIERLDKWASNIGVLMEVEGNKRTFPLNDSRKSIVELSPGGKGAIRARVIFDDDVDVDTVVSIERAEQLIWDAYQNTMRDW